MTKALAIRTGPTLSATDHDPIERWDTAASRYLGTRKGEPEGNTAKTYGRTLRAYKDFALESGLNPWAGDAIVAYNKLQNRLRKANGGDLADDTIREGQGGQLEGCGSVQGPGPRVAGAEGCRLCTFTQCVQENRP